MRRVYLLLGGLGLAGLIAGLFLLQPGKEPGNVTFLGEVVPPDRIALGETLYAENCASCHGVKLEGQPDWKTPLESGRMPAPPHDASGHTWHHADRQLFDITKRGLGAVVEGYESDMPAFADTLTDDQIRAVLAYIKSTWPARERAFQDDVSTSDGAR